MFGSLWRWLWWSAGGSGVPPVAGPKRQFLGRQWFGRQWLGREWSGGRVPITSQLRKEYLIGRDTTTSSLVGYDSTRLRLIGKDTTTVELEGDVE